MSTWLQRSARATVLSYLIVLALLLAPVLIYILVGVLERDEPPRWILVPNPVSALFSALSPATPSDGPAGIFWGLGMAMGGNLGVLSGSRPLAEMPRPLYHYTLPLYGGISLVLYLLATRLVQPTHPWRVRWQQIVIALTLLAIFGSLVALGFAIAANRYQRTEALDTPTIERIMPPPAVQSEMAVPMPEEPTATLMPTAIPTTPMSPLPTPTPTGQTRPDDS